MKIRLAQFIWLAVIAGFFLSGCSEEEGLNDLGTVEPRIVDFGIQGLDVNSTVDQDTLTIRAKVPPYADINSMVPIVETSYGASVTPSPGQAVDFSSPVAFTVENNGTTRDYTAHVTYGGLDKKSTRLLLIGTSDAASEISNGDEAAATNWGLSSFDKAQYMSFNQLANNSAVLDSIDVVWWHYDAEPELPDGALADAAITALVDYRDRGGSIYLSGFATQYTETLGIVPEGKGPNEVGGAPQEFENPDPWGISFKGYASHDIFQGLRKADGYDYPAAFLISADTWRKDNKAWWVVVDNPDAFPDNGIGYCSTEWDGDRNVLIILAEFPGSESQGSCIAFSAGAYDWYTSHDVENTYMDNIHQITENILLYLATISAEIGQ
ncbi:MAG: DUF4960 domain-containing protein [Bacteroidales bacterium]|nr:DUF4960 domain-containing protein [Bacteroidales bacterium]